MCNHSHASHFYTRHVGVKTDATQTLVKKEQWEAAKAEKENIAKNESASWIKL